MRTIIPCLLVAVLLLPSAGVQAQQTEAPEAPGVGDLTEPGGLSTGVDAGLGFSRIDEDSFIDTHVGFTLGYQKLEVGLQIPLRFKVIDDPPEDDDIIRSQDWDEPSDYLRVLRFIRYGSRRDTYYVRAGELVDVTMGHGTIVNGYNNVVDVNHFQWGIDGAVNLRFGGLELLLDNIVSAEVMGLRTYVRPWTFVDPESYWSRLAFGISFVGDRDAPSRLILTDSGEYVFDSERNVAVDEWTETGLLGFDVELQAFSNPFVSLTPYTDVNLHLGYGAGLHMGVLSNFSFTDSFGLDTRLEFRALGEGYTPEYFDGLYEVEKFFYRSLDGTGQLRPKLQVLDLAPPEAIVGYLIQGTFGIIHRIFLTLGFEDYEGGDNSSFLARLSLPQLGPVTVGAYYINQNFDGISELFDLDSALLVSEARVMAYQPIYIICQYSRRFSAQPDGTYEPVDDWSVGAGVSFSF